MSALSGEPQPDPPVHALDDPERQWKVVKALLIAAPFTFVGCYLLAWVQGAEARYAALIGAVAVAMCLAAALAIRLLGSKSCMALVAVKLALLFVKR